MLSKREANGFELHIATLRKGVDRSGTHLGYLCGDPCRHPQIESTRFTERPATSHTSGGGGGGVGEETLSGSLGKMTPQRKECLPMSSEV